MSFHASAMSTTTALTVIATSRLEKIGASPATAPKRTTTIRRGRETMEAINTTSNMKTTLHNVSGSANSEPAKVPGDAVTMAATRYPVVRLAFSVFTVNVNTK